MQTFLLFLVKLIEYNFFAVSECSNPCVGPLPMIKKYFLLLKIFGDEHISTPKLLHFCQFHYQMKKIILYRIQYHIQNICTYQYQYVLLIELHQRNNFSVLDNCLYQHFLYLINNVNIYCFSIIKCNFILF